MTVIIWNATVAMIGCYFVGRVVGGIIQQTLDTHLADYKARHPIPTDEQLIGAPGASASATSAESATGSATGAAVNRASA